jgi:hypothetical protein
MQPQEDGGTLRGFADRIHSRLPRRNGGTARDHRFNHSIALLGWHEKES